MAFGSLAGLVLLVAGCTTPIEVTHTGGEAERHLDANAVSTGELSEPTRIVLHQQNLSDRLTMDPDGTIAFLHQIVARGGAPDAFFALAELSYLRALNTYRPATALAAAVYAYAFLFPDDVKQRPSAFDPRFRAACVIYNRGLAWAFATPDRSRVDLRAGRVELPFGSIDIAFDPAAIRWGDVQLSGFIPAASLSVTGLEALYRRPGLGASLAAEATPRDQQGGLRIEPNVKVPVTALLRVDNLSRDLGQGHLKGRLEVHPAFEPSDVQIGGQSVPLETDTSKAFALGLSDPKVWESEFSGFLNGNLFDRAGTQLVGLEPYRAGQIPVVFIHGTGSSSGRWANLINDLQGDPVIREHFQFWSFSYATGNPTAFSAEELRAALAEAVGKLDPQNRDPALHQIVVIGHSQGGLLAKWLAIHSGSRLWDVLSAKPPEALPISAESARLLREAYFVEPMPEVKRVIFIATPQRGSFVAESPIGQLLARLVTPQARLLGALRELTDLEGTGDLRFRPGEVRLASVWSMSPTNPLLQVFASIPVSPKIAAHSIIAVQGDGPVETGDDGVVSYQSAHIQEAASELVVRSGHSVQSDPRTVAEVRRILLLHLTGACPGGCKAAAGPMVQASRP
jgi:pimeloyl-ACP methyl ester carboxylesterase